MKLKPLVVSSFGLLVLLSCKQPKPNVNAFSLKGTIDGSHTEYVVLSYLDSSNVYISDTLAVENRSFTKEGYLINTQMVSLTSNLTGRNMEDPNRLVFFLEPNQTDVRLEEGNFSNAYISGSKTQIEYENLNKAIRPFYQKIEEIRDERQVLIDKTNDLPNKKSEVEIDQLTNRWQQLLDDIKDVRLNYVMNHPQSYVSADVISSYRKILSTDSLSMFYSKLDHAIKKSSYGLLIEEQLNLHIVNSGDVAPNFSKSDIDGTMISLNQFRGKTVLLDFGASWCVPCQEEIPEVKRIYDDYHSLGLEIIGISFDKDRNSWKENVKNENLNWHHIYEGINNVGKEGSISKMYYVQPIPAYILIDENGMIVDRYGGADKNVKSLSDLDAKLNTLIFSN